MVAAATWVDQRGNGLIPECLDFPRAFLLIGSVPSDSCGIWTQDVQQSITFSTRTQELAIVNAESDIICATS
jgi:hypothetical protein